MRHFTRENKENHREEDKPKLGLRANLPQFLLFSVLTLWIGWFLGMERVVVPILAKDSFQISSFILIMSFIATFGFTKAILNMVSGRWSDKIGRKPVLILGWILGLPVPIILILAPSWSWVVIANVLMGFNQALTWTMTVTSKIDLVGPKNRGLALGINEFSGYFGQASGGVITGFLASSYGLRPYPFYFGLATVLLGLTFSLAFVKESRGHAIQEDFLSSEKNVRTSNDAKRKSFFEIFSLTSWKDRTLLSASQAGLVEKFTDTLVWAMFPLFLITKGIDVLTIGLIVGLYQTVWGISQLFTGALSDRIGRKFPIVSGMWIMSLGIFLAAYTDSILGFYLSAVVSGFGMALTYPVLLAVVADVAGPKERGSYLGVYRFWRDSGYGFAALLLGAIADYYGIMSSFYLSSLLLFFSGSLVMVLMKETLHK